MVMPSIAGMIDPFGTFPGTDSPIAALRPWSCRRVMAADLAPAFPGSLASCRPVIATWARDRCLASAHEVTAPSNRPGNPTIATSRGGETGHAAPRWGRHSLERSAITIRRDTDDGMVATATSRTMVLVTPVVLAVHAAIPV
jgi:hypothetical protein